MVSIAIVGSAYVVVHADTRAVRGQIERAFKEASSAVDNAGKQLGKDFADSFGKSMQDEMDGIIPETLKQDVSRVAQEAAADYSDEFSDRLGEEMNDTVARTLAEDSDGLEQRGRRDAGSYAGSFAESLETHFESLVSGLVAEDDLGQIGDAQGRDYGASFGSALTDATRRTTPTINTQQTDRNLALAGVASALAFGDGFDRGSSNITRSLAAAGSGGGKAFFGGLFSAFPSPAEISAASRSVTILIGVGNLLGPLITQLVAGLSALVSGLFSIGAAAAQATPSLIVLPSYLTAIVQAGSALAIGFQGVGDAISTALDPEATAGELQAELKGLAPAAKEFVFEVRSLQDAWGELRRATQQALFPGLTDALNRLGNNIFPTLENAMTGAGEALGDLAVSFSKRISAPESLNNIGIVANTNTRSIRLLGEALLDLGEGFTAAIAAASPLIDRFNVYVSSVSSSVGASLRAKAASGELTNTFQNAGDVAAQLGDIIGNTTDGIMNLGRAATPAGQGLLNSFEGATASFKEFTQAGLESGEYFEEFSQIAENVRAINLLFGDLGGILFDLGADSSVEETFTILREAIPAITDIVTAFGDAGPAFADLVVSLADLINTLTQTEAITIFLNVLNSIATVLDTILNLPIIAQLLTLILPVVAASRALQFAWISLRTIFIGVFLPLTQISGRFVTIRTAATTSLAAIKAFGTTGTASMGTYTAATNLAATATTRLAAATGGLATARTVAAGTGALSVASTAGLAAAAARTPVRGPVSVIPVGGPAAIAKTGTAAATAATKVGILGRSMNGLRIASTALIGVPVSPAFLGFAAATLPVAGAIAVLAKSNHDYRTDLEATASEVVNATDATRNQIDGILAGSEAYATYKDAVGAANVDQGLFRRAVLGSDEDVGKLTKSISGVNILTEQNIDSTDLQTQALENLGNTSGFTAEQILDLQEEIQAQRAAADEAAVAAGFTSQAHLRLSARVEESNNAFQDMAATMDGVVDRNIETRLTAAKVSVELRKMKTTLGAVETSGGKLTKQGFLDFTAAYQGVRSFSTELARLGRVGAAEKALLGVRDGLIALRKEGSITKTEFQSLIKSFELTPEKIEFRVELLGIEGAIGRIDALKAQRQKLLDEGFSPQSEQVTVLRLDIREAQARLDRFVERANSLPERPIPIQVDTRDALQKVSAVLDPKGNPVIPVQVDTRDAERGLGGLAKRKWPKPTIGTIADTKGASSDIDGLSKRNWPKPTVTPKADTKPAEEDITKAAKRTYPKAEVGTFGHTSPAINDITRAANRKYGPATVDTTANTSGFVNDIISAAAAVTASATVIVQGIFGAPKNAAKGGIFPGYAPGRDIIPAMLSPGEAVLRPEATRALGPSIIHAINRDWTRVAKRLRMAFNGTIPRFAHGGIAIPQSSSTGEFGQLIASISNIASSSVSGNTSGRDFNAAIAAQRAGDTYIINPSPGMNEIALAENVSRRQAFNRRRGT